MFSLNEVCELFMDKREKENPELFFFFFIVYLVNFTFQLKSIGLHS